MSAPTSLYAYLEYSECECARGKQLAVLEINIYNIYHLS